MGGERAYHDGAFPTVDVGVTPQFQQNVCPWNCREDNPALKTMRQLTAAIPNGELLGSRRSARGEGRNDDPLPGLCGGVLRHRNTDTKAGDGEALPALVDQAEAKVPTFVSSKGTLSENEPQPRRQRPPQKTTPPPHQTTTQPPRMNHDTQTSTHRNESPQRTPRTAESLAAKPILCVYSRTVRSKPLHDRLARCPSVSAG